VSTALPPVELLHRLKESEQRMGRTPTFRNGPRLIDVDILFYDDIILSTDALVIPHPRALERAFVLRPLLDIAPGMIDPRTARPLADSLDAVAMQAAAPVTAPPEVTAAWRAA
jgi:7,8-dihydro-6-hydroxymethylpterin-pyrophosphokinase